MKKITAHFTHHFVQHNRHILSIFVLLLLAFLLHFLNVEFAYANTLTNTNVEPASLVAGATSSATVNFTTSGSIPANGKVKVKFGPGFTVSEVTGASCSSMDGGFTFSSTAAPENLVTISRDGSGTDTVAGNAETCVIDGVKNPSGSGSTGLYAIQTLTVGMSNIDLNTGVTADAIVPNALSSTTVTPSPLTAGATSTVTVNFTTVTPIQPTDMIKVSFPTGFSFGFMTVNCPTMDGGFSFSMDILILKILRSGGGVVAPGPQTCVITNVINPGSSGTTAPFQVKVADSTGGSTRDQDLNVAGSTIVANNLGGADVQPGTLVTGETSMVTVTFTTTSNLLSTDKIRVIFPAGFTFGVSAVTCASNGVPFDGTLGYTVSSPSVIINRTGGTTQAPGLKVCTISSARNPATAGLTADYTIQTYATPEALKDQFIVGGDVMVAPSAGGNGTGSRNGSSSSGDSNSRPTSRPTETIKAPTFSDVQEVSNTPITVPADGLITHPIYLRAPTGASLLIRKATRVTTVTGAVYRGTLAPPMAILQPKLPKVLNNTLIYRHADGFATSQAVFFDQDVLIGLPVPAGVNGSVLKIYFYNPSIADYQVVDGGGTLTKDGRVLTASVNFLATFVLAEVQPTVGTIPILSQPLVRRTVPFRIFVPKTKK